jgi:hypothetical protein
MRSLRAVDIEFILKVLDVPAALRSRLENIVSGGSEKLSK